MSAARPAAGLARARQLVLHVADDFLPPAAQRGFRDDSGAAEDAARQARSAILLTWLGVAFAAVFAGFYGFLGSPWSAAAIAAIVAALLAVPPAVRRGLPLRVIGNAVTAVTWLATFLVGARTGGFTSPAVVWSFFHPITTFAACGKRSALVWSGLSSVQIGLFFAAERLDLRVTQDLSAVEVDVLRASGFIGCIVANAIVIVGLDALRRSSQAALDEATRLIERQRILDDMHDGVGSQLLGLLMEVRAKRIDDDRLAAGLETCLDDLKLIVDSLDPAERSFDLALAELRARVSPRCAAAGVELTWSIDAAGSPLQPTAGHGLQVLRAAPEMLSNALRHAHTNRIELSLRRLEPGRPIVELAVRDHGIGMEAARAASDRPPGRGLTSLATRARRIDGELSIRPADPGTQVSLRFRA